MLEKRVSTTGHIYATLADLQQWEKNPRDIFEENAENLKILIATLGLFKPLFVTDEGIMVGGNMRLPAISWLNENVLEFVDSQGNKQIIDRRHEFDEVKITELGFAMDQSGKWRATLDGKVQPKLFEDTEQIMIEYAFADNNTSGYLVQKKAGELLLPYKDILPLKLYDLPLSKEKPMELFLKEYDTNKSKNEGEEDEPPPVEDTAISKVGEIYQLGRHRLMCGNAGEKADLLLLMNGEKADLLFTDPPYNVDYGSKNEALNETDRGNRIDSNIQNDKFKTSPEFYDFLLNVFQNMNENANEGASIYVCHADSERINFTSAFTDGGFKLAQVLIWSKSHFVIGRQDYQWQHEPILYGWKEGKEHYFNGGRGQTTIWHIDKPAASKEHPTMKPIQLIARAINNSSPADTIVLDVFSGSGSTLIACEQLGRTCYAMEIEPKYVDVIRKRYARYIGQKDNWEQATPVLREGDNNATSGSTV